MRIVLVLTLLGCACGNPSETPRETPSQAGPMSYEDMLAAVASDIEALRDRFPQLSEFSAREHCDPERLTIGYSYRTHRPQGRPGWAGGVPNPDPDGIWFHIDLHDPDSTAQIHTQPAVPRMSYRDKRVMFLILNGSETRPVSAEIAAILARHGATGSR